MTRRHHRLFILVALLPLLLGIPSNAIAEIQNPRKHKLGLGAHIGWPTAITLKYWVSDQNAVDGGIGWTFGESILLYSDMLWHFRHLFKDTSALWVNDTVAYIGAGAYLGFLVDNELKKTSTSTVRLGIRVPFGMEWKITKIPVVIGLEITPGLSLISSTAVILQGGFIARYFF